MKGNPPLVDCPISNLHRCNKELCKKAQINRKVSNGTGFIPCTKHAHQILKKKITLEDILHNRQCETKFPNDNGKVIQELRTKRKHIWLMKELKEKCNIL